MGDKKGKPKKSQKTTNPQEPKEEREKANPSCGRKLFQP
jgi:hypothetical protein